MHTFKRSWGKEWPACTYYVARLCLIIPVRNYIWNKTWSLVSNSSLSKTFALGSLETRVFQKNLIFEIDYGVEFEHTYGQYERNKKKLLNLSFSILHSAKVLLKLEFDTKDQVLLYFKVWSWKQTHFFMSETGP